MSTNRNRIVLKGENSRHEEYVAAGTIVPGMLLVQDSAGKVKAHNSQAGKAQALFALEDALQGKTIDDNYISGALVGCAYPQRGDVILALVLPGASIDKGDFLSSAGDGTLQKESSTGYVVAVAEEASSDEDVDSDVNYRRLAVRIL